MPVEDYTVIHTATVFPFRTISTISEIDVSSCGAAGWKGIVSHRLYSISQSVIDASSIQSFLTSYTPTQVTISDVYSFHWIP